MKKKVIGIILAVVAIALIVFSVPLSSEGYQDKFIGGYGYGMEIEQSQK